MRADAILSAPGGEPILHVQGEPFFKTFTDKPIVHAKEATEVLFCLSCESREEVDGVVARAVAAGGSVPRTPQDHGFMYAHDLEDIDGPRVGARLDCATGRQAAAVAARGTPMPHGKHARASERCTNSLLTFAR
jgi:hypothetical protein